MQPERPPSAPRRAGPYVPATQSVAELTVKALVLGVSMAVVLGAANAYLGMKAGLTVAATFPAAVVAMAALRVFKGTILEENIARTTASVGEALVAGAIFTIPAFVIAGAWETIHYWEATAIMMIGGVLGVLFVVALRRTLVVEAELPFPESVAAAEIVKAGQGGATGAKYVFGAMGIAGLWELFKNPNGILWVRDYVDRFFAFDPSTVGVLGRPVTYGGGLLVQSPGASPALMGVGFIVGLRVAAVLFAGAVLGWLVLVPLALFLSPGLVAGMAPGETMTDLAFSIWSNQIRPLAVGTMIVAAFYTLWNLRKSLATGIGKAFRDMQSGALAEGGEERTDKDLDMKRVFLAILLMAVPVFFLYRYFSGSLGGSLLLTVVMVVLGFLFAAVAGYLVGLIGSSNNPISGLTLSALLISAVLMVAIGLTDLRGVAAVLGVAGVVCCSAGIAGDMMQDFKVGHILGGTPWKMQIAEIIGVIAAAMVLAWPLAALDRVYHIGSPELPAPQAGLMALMARGIVGGEMAWPLVIVGMFLALGLILIKSPSPMLIAVGMYLPFFSTAAIFVGGLMRWAYDTLAARRGADEDERLRGENMGTLVASGIIAGEALMAVLLAFLVLGADLPGVAGVAGWVRSAMQAASLTSPSFLLGLVGYAFVAVMLIALPLKKMRDPGLPASRIE